MRTNLIVRIAATMLMTGILSGCVSSHKEVIREKPVYVNPPPNDTTVVVPPAPAPAR